MDAYWLGVGFVCLWVFIVGFVFGVVDYSWLFGFFVITRLVVVWFVWVWVCCVVFCVVVSLLVVCLLGLGLVGLGWCLFGLPV